MIARVFIVLMSVLGTSFAVSSVHYNVKSCLVADLSVTVTLNSTSLIHLKNVEGGSGQCNDNETLSNLMVNLEKGGSLIFTFHHFTDGVYLEGIDVRYQTIEALKELKERLSGVDTYYECNVPKTYAAFDSSDGTVSVNMEYIKVQAFQVVNNTYSGSGSMCVQPTTHVPTSTPGGNTTAAPSTTKPSNGTTTAPPNTTEPSNRTTTAPPNTTEPSNRTTTAPPTTTEPSNGTTTAPPTTTEPSNRTTTAPPSTTEPSNGTTTAPPNTTEPSNRTTTAPPSTTEPSNGTTTAPPNTTEPSNRTTTAPPTTTEPSKGTTTSYVPTTLSPPKSKIVSLAFEANGTYCIVVTFNGTIQVLRPNKTDLVYHIASNGTVTGSCGVSVQMIETKLPNGWILKFSFATSTSKVGRRLLADTTYHLSAVAVTYYDDGKPITKSATYTDQYQVNVGQSYQCKSQDTLKLDPVTLFVEDFQAQAFRTSNNTDFSSGVECSADTPASNDVVPIVVGVCLGVLVIVIVVAYLIGRQRQQRQNNYESMN